MYIECETKPLASILATRSNPRPSPSTSLQWLIDRCKEAQAVCMSKVKPSDRIAGSVYNRITLIRSSLMAAVSIKAFRTFRHNMADLPEDQQSGLINKMKLASTSIRQALQSSKHEVSNDTANSLDDIIEHLKAQHKDMIHNEWKMTRATYADFIVDALTGSSKIWHTLTKLAQEELPMQGTDVKSTDQELLQEQELCRPYGR